MAEVVRGAAGRQMKEVRMEGVVIYRGVHVGVLCVNQSAMGRRCVSASGLVVRKEVRRAHRRINKKTAI